MWYFRSFDVPMFGDHITESSAHQLWVRVRLNLPTSSSVSIVLSKLHDNVRETFHEPGYMTVTLILRVIDPDHEFVLQWYSIPDPTTSRLRTLCEVDTRHLAVRMSSLDTV